MRSKILALLLLLAPVGVMAEGVVIDPAVNAFLEISCVFPTKREDNTQLFRDEIQSVTFFHTTVVDQNNWTKHSVNLIDCAAIMDMTAFPDGQYYVTATVTDTEERQSVYADNSLVTKGAYAFEVKRGVEPPIISPPTPPQAIMGTIIF